MDNRQDRPHRQPLPPATTADYASTRHHGPSDDHQRPANTTTNALAITSLTVGIIGSLVLPVVGPILAIVFGAIALTQIRQSGQPGRNLAKWGLGLGIFSLSMTIIAISAAIFFFVKGHSSKPHPTANAATSTSVNSGSQASTSTDDSSTTINQAEESVRDSQRSTDLNTIQKGLEEYFVDNNQYPDTLSELTIGDTPIMDSIPTDPLNSGPYVYIYTPANSNTTYTLDACLENSQDAASIDSSDLTSAVPPCTTETIQLVNQN